MGARRFHRMPQHDEGPMTTTMHKWRTRATRGAFTRGLALLLATLGGLAMTATPTGHCRRSFRARCADLPDFFGPIVTVNAGRNERTGFLGPLLE